MVHVGPIARFWAARLWATRPQTRTALLWAALAVAWTASLASAATIRVTTTVDELDFIPNTTCSLREAIVSANENRDVGGCSHSGTYGSDTILVPSGTFTLTRSDFRSNDQDRDDLDLLSSIVIDGAGRASTIIDAGVFQGIEVAAGVTATVRDLTLRRAATTTPDYFAWGIENAGTLSLVDVTLAYLPGTALRNTGTVNAQRLVVRDSWARGGIENYGVMHLTASHVQTSEVEAGDLVATARYAGGINNFGGSLSLTSSSVVSNRATGQAMAGGILNDGGTLTILNSTVSGNVGGRNGGGILTAGPGAVTTLLSSTVSDNEAGVAGGGIARLEGSFRVEASIVAGNRDTEGDLRSLYPDCFGAFTSWGFNLIGNVGSLATNCSGFTATGDRVGTVTTPLDPRLGTRTAAGGSLVTVVHPLLVGSPAVDAGALGISDACPDVDQRGVARPIDGDGNGFTHCDVGAYEAPPARADLAMDLAALPTSVLTGGAVDVTAEVRNLGPYIANGATATIVLPSGFGFLSAPAGCSHASGTVTCSLGNLASGASATRTVRAAAAATPGTYRATARAASNSVDPTGGNDAAFVDIQVSVPRADLVAAVQAPAEVEVRDAFAVQVAVRNLGPHTARDVVLEVDVLGASVTDDGVCRPSGIADRWWCSYGDLTSGAQRDATLQLAAPTSTGSVTVTVRATTTTLDPVESNDVATASVDVLEVATAAADLVTQMEGPTVVAPGEPIPYTITVVNLGPDLATGVLIVDELPAGTAPAEMPMACALQSGAVVCQVGDLPVGETATVALTLTAPSAEGDVVNRATVRSSTPDPNGDNDTAQASTAVVAGAGAPVRVDVTGAAPSRRPADAGTEVVLDLLAVADGTTELTGLTLTAAGSGDASAGLAAVRVRLLAETAGPPEGADGEELAVGTFTAGDAPLQLAFASPVALEDGIARRLVVEVDLAGSGTTAPASALTSFGLLGLLGWLAVRRRRAWSVALLGLALAAALGACGGAVQDVPPQAQTRTYELQLVALEAEAPATVAGLPLLGDVLEVTED